LSRVSAPTIGGEWLITRKHGALSVAIDQSMFEESAGIFDPSLAGSVRPVDIKDMRRYSATLLAFPLALDQIRPYVGVGIALNVIQNAAPIGNFVSTASQDDVFTRVNDQSSRASAIFTGGLQINLGRAAVFGQASAMSTRDRFLINGSNYTFAFEGGVRYNLVNALENIWP
jgi:opacity protein-like surface antigen